MVCVLYFMTGASEGSTESGFMKKPRIEPAIPGLQDKGLSPTPWQLLIKNTLQLLKLMGKKIFSILHSMFFVYLDP